MNPCLLSAGLPGASSCSKRRESLYRADLVTDSLKEVGHDLSVALEFHFIFVEDPSSNVVTGAQALTNKSGVNWDRLSLALGGIATKGLEEWQFAPAVKGAFAKLEGTTTSSEVDACTSEGQQ